MKQRELESVSGKHVIVTGAFESVIGAAITTRLLDDGYDVAGTFTGEKPAAADVLAEKHPGRLVAHEVDFTSRDSLAGFADSQRSRVHSGLIHVESVFIPESIEEFSYEGFERTFSVNVFAFNQLVRSLASDLTDGSVVVITSTEASVGSFGASAYASSRAATHNLVMSLANLFGPQRTRVNAVAPGWIGGMADGELFAKSTTITPLGRLGAPEEVANVAAFLLSDQASFISGSVVTVDGAYSAVDMMSKYEYEAPESH